MRQQAAKDAQAAKEAREAAEAARAEAARAEAGRAEAARQAAADQAAARAESARADAERQAAAQQAAAQAAARAQQEAARQEGEQAAANQAAANQEAARQEAARQEAAGQDVARQEAARAEAARRDEARAAAAQREERLRAIGRQLNEEADRRKAAEAARDRPDRPDLPSSWSTARRGRIFGRSDSNEELVRYAEAWSRKIELNMTFDAVREAVRQPHADPVVLVAVRSDGSVESVNFVRSSGVPAIDEAVRNVVQAQANYPVFQPALARDYDVVEIRRTWHFDVAIRLY